MSNGLKDFMTRLANVYRTATGSTDKIVANTIPDLYEELLENAGSGGSDILAYVTFMTHDGLTELFKMPVIKGDDCKDPISHGDIETPTKESTAQYDYSYSGWSDTIDGSVNKTVLNSVTENKTVYASYTSQVRYYNQYFYDGETLVQTLSTAYGSIPNPNEPYKENYIFMGWDRELVAVTAEASYYAQFEYDDGYIKDSWETIAENVTNGTYKTKYQIGDMKQVQMTDYTGTVRTMDVEIVAFDHDTLSDGTKAGITFLTKCRIILPGTMDLAYSTSSNNGWKKSQVRTNLNNNTINVPTDLFDVIKEVRKSSNTSDKVWSAVYDKMWIPSMLELNVPTIYTNYATNTGILNDYDEPYVERFKTNLSYNVAEDLNSLVNHSDSIISRTAQGTGTIWRISQLNSGNIQYYKPIVGSTSSVSESDGKVISLVGFCI